MLQGLNWNYFKSEYMLIANDQLFNRQPPFLGTVDAFEIEEKAREKMKNYPESIGYIFGSAGTFKTNKANLEAFDRWKIMQVHV